MPGYVAVGAVVVCAAAGALYLGRMGGWKGIPDGLRAAGSLGLLVSYGLIVMQTFVPFAPFAVLAAFNATVHGYWPGYAATLAGAFTGAILFYGLTLRLMHRYARRRLERFLARHERMRRMAQSVERERGWSLFFVLVVLRLQPWLPSSIIDVLAGAAKVPALLFAVSTLVGQAPIIALESYVGHRVMTFQSHQNEVWWLAGAALGLLLLYGLARVYRHGGRGQGVRRRP